MWSIRIEGNSGCLAQLYFWVPHFFCFDNSWIFWIVRAPLASCWPTLNNIVSFIWRTCTPNTRVFRINRFDSNTESKKFPICSKEIFNLFTDFNPFTSLYLLTILLYHHIFFQCYWMVYSWRIKTRFIFSYSESYHIHTSTVAGYICYLHFNLLFSLNVVSSS